MHVPFSETYFSSTDFNRNIAVLTAVAGHKPSETPLLAAVLQCKGEADFLLRSMPGKYVSCQLIHVLADGWRERQITGDTYKNVTAFFQPLFGEEGHPIVDYVNKGPFSIEILLVWDDINSIQETFKWREYVTPENPVAKDAVDRALQAMELGLVRVADRGEDGEWVVNQWAKQAVLLSFAQNGMEQITGAPGDATWYDKVPSLFAGRSEEGWKAAGFRAVPGAIARRSAYVGPKVVLRPSYVDMGAYVDEGTMVDTWASIGSCAQIGRNCHLSGGVGIGGVLEPLQASPTIIEDNCFIGARSEVVEGVIVREGSVLGMGVFIGQSTKIFNRMTGEVTYGEVPAFSVVVAGSLLDPSGVHLYCAVIVKRVDARTRGKTSINDLLRV